MPIAPFGKSSLLVRIANILNSSESRTHRGEGLTTCLSLNHSYQLLDSKQQKQPQTIIPTLFFPHCEINKIWNLPLWKSKVCKDILSKFLRLNVCQYVLDGQQRITSLFAVGNTFRV